jgi:phosphatidylserine/phosphatidylglycerophosphate/cardiolipin synthase-like enzyme
VKLLVQPGDGVASLVKGIAGAKNCIEIVIFRFNQKEIERALANAVSRGVSVHALIAHTNRAGEENLRQLEMRLLAAGVTVARTADDLVRYHGKLMIIDRRDLYLLAFNLTYSDIEHSRSFGVITSSRNLVREAVKLFEADTQRHRYDPGLDQFVVSPTNARKQLASFIKGAKKQLIIYDPKVSDPFMVRLLEERSKAGVDVKIIGRLTRKSARLAVHRQPQMRLHTRTMVRDGQLVFLGSQSLRELELDARREVGIIFRESRIANRLVQTFQADWALAEQARERGEKEQGTPAAKVAKKVAKAVTRELPPVAPVLNIAVREMVGAAAGVEFDADEVEEIVKDAVKEVVKEVVKDAVEEAVAQNGGRRI